MGFTQLAPFGAEQEALKIDLKYFKLKTLRQPKLDWTAVTNPVNGPVLFFLIHKYDKLL